MKYCPKCNKEYNSDDAQFCNLCGSTLIEKTSNEKSNEETKIKCPSCGNLIPNDQMYCQFCGASLNSKSDDGVSGNKKKDANGKTTLIVIIIAVIAVMGAIGVRVYNSYFRKEPVSTQRSSASQTSTAENNQISTTKNDNDAELANSTVASTTKNETMAETSMTTVVETTNSNIPPELQKYSSDLVYEGRTYRITLQEDDWYINYRSEPVYHDFNATNSNIVGKLKSGTEIYVEYIYNRTWVVFEKDGRYVFSSMYGSNDPTHNRLMTPVNYTAQATIMNNTPEHAGLVLRSEPSYYSDEITILREGTNLIVISNNVSNGYIRVQTTDGVFEGWLLEKYLSKN